MISDEELARLKRHAQEGPAQTEVKRWRVLELIEEIEQIRNESCESLYSRAITKVLNENLIQGPWPTEPERPLEPPSPDDGSSPTSGTATPRTPC